MFYYAEQCLRIVMCEQQLADGERGFSKFRSLVCDG